LARDRKLDKDRDSIVVCYKNFSTCCEGAHVCAAHPELGF